tara:strand:+ start:180 stop:1661 length:1482 start_codon:yes stop_codon:yes gene_type:complete
MKYSKKIRKKIPRKKKFTNQKKKKYQKKTKRINKRGGSLRAEEQEGEMDWFPSAPELFTKLSGAPMGEVRENAKIVNKLIDQDPSLKTGYNCVPLATANTYGITGLGKNTDAAGLGEGEFNEWIKEDGTTIEYQQEKGLYYMDYFRNFSSRPAVGEDGETNEKIWTDEPMIEFLEKLLKYGLSHKLSTRGYSADDPDRKYGDGCIHVAIYFPNSTDWHDVNICIDQGEIFIIDIQDKQYNKQRRNKIRGRIGGEELKKYLSPYSQNHFAIITEDPEKSQRHKEILENRLDSISLNTELKHEDVNKNILIQRLKIMMNLDTVITPSILSFPYDLPGGSLPDLLPLIFNIDEKSLWPDHVKDKDYIYYKFQDNRYPPIIRQTALSAILNAEDDVVLNHLISLAPDGVLPGLAPEPTLSLGNVSNTVNQAAANQAAANQAAANQAAAREFNSEVAKSAEILLNAEPGPVTFADYGTLSGVAKIQANKREARKAAEN